MRVHRFFVGEEIKLKQDFWLHDNALLWQWNRVLRFRPGQKVGLFDGTSTDRLYEVVELSKTEAHLKMITELEPSMPKRHVYLFWSLLKKDNNDHILQKCTELGVSNFVPVLSERTIRTNFNIDRTHKIVIEASEQSGRSTIPVVREPVHLQKAVEQYREGLVGVYCEQGGEDSVSIDTAKKIGIFIGPEGGWSDQEKQLFASSGFLQMNLSNHILRAETASIVAVSKLL